MSKRYVALIALIAVALASSMVLMNACAPTSSMAKPSKPGNIENEAARQAYVEAWNADIDALPPVDELTLEDKLEVSRLRHYLDTGLILYVDDERLNKLKEAETRVSELQAEAGRLTSTQQQKPTTSYTPTAGNTSTTTKTPSNSILPSDLDVLSNPILIVLFCAWYIVYIIQTFLALGTAYRKTKKNGDNGISLFGWLFAYSLAAIVPGLGVYLWKRSKQSSE